MNPHISLAALKTFAEVAEQQSLSKAAASLCISPSAVSHQMKLLEQQLGLKLFQRRAHGIQLTAAGEQLAQHASRAMQQVRLGVRKACQLSDRSRLVVAAIPSFCQQWLTPRLMRFNQLHSDIELHLIAQDRLADFNQQAIDLHIHFGDGQAIGLHSELFLTEQAVPVCHPAMLEPYSGPFDLLCSANSRLLHYQGGDEDQPGGISWSEWLVRHNLQPHPQQQHSWFSHLSLAINAARHSQGIALGWRSLIEQELASGELVPLAAEGTPLKYAHYLVAPEHSWENPALQQFIEWLKTERDQEAAASVGQ
ncbi:LysR substrate-binding domain-containing protein [Marinobacterium arenosum]|uniref:LysR substrate-binding domain-containing protein n=1 Tax=Marinobacterium arenosum TaxID=2862496 RepID=UPI001C947E06|nr:LysR substrate-binding domain-containing protein [Marinobacterium arenosum]MBY4676485.1 LysR family transcriptional regulator [Marinobacterium arenosum]